jgi:hypothetical protein
VRAAGGHPPESPSAKEPTRRLSRDNLSDIFGEENITALDFDDAVGLGFSELDALLLSYVGLPCDAGTAFTAELDGEPGVFSVQSLDAPDGSTSAAVFLGAPGRNQMRRCASRPSRTRGARTRSASSWTSWGTAPTTPPNPGCQASFVRRPTEEDFTAQQEKQMLVDTAARFLAP